MINDESLEALRCVKVDRDCPKGYLDLRYCAIKSELTLEFSRQFRTSSLLAKKFIDPRRWTVAIGVKRDRESCICKPFSKLKRNIWTKIVAFVIKFAYFTRVDVDMSEEAELQ